MKSKPVKGSRDIPSADADIAAMAGHGRIALNGNQEKVLRMHLEKDLPESKIDFAIVQIDHWMSLCLIPSLHKDRKINLQKSLKHRMNMINAITDLERVAEVDIPRHGIEDFDWLEFSRQLAKLRLNAEKDAESYRNELEGMSPPLSHGRRQLYQRALLVRAVYDIYGQNAKVSDGNSFVQTVGLILGFLNVHLSDVYGMIRDSLKQVPSLPVSIESFKGK